MARNINISIDEFYHIYNRGNDKREIFHNDVDHTRFQVLLYLCNNIKGIHLGDYRSSSISNKELFNLPREETLVDIGAYCLMPNHFHLLIKEKIEGGTSLFMQKLSTAYTMYYNKKYNKTGSLFGGRFKAKHIDSDQYLKYQYSYIHLNPVSIIDGGWKNKKIIDTKKAKSFINSYDYSSYMDYLGIDRKEGVILNKNPFPDYFSNSTEFSEMIDEWLNFSN